MKTIWKTLIQPKMDYCSQLWSPSDQDSIVKLESVQRHFTSKVQSLKDFGRDFKSSSCTHKNADVNDTC